MIDLLPALEALAAPLEAQLVHVHETAQYCMYLLTVEAEKIRLIDTITANQRLSACSRTKPGSGSVCPGRPRIDEYSMGRRKRGVRFLA
jgi:hypothetical protein